MKIFVILIQVLSFNFLLAKELSEALQGNCRLFGCNTVVKFDLRTQTCCGGTVYVKDLDKNGNEKTKCCYGQTSTMYNVETQECCGGEVISKNSSSTKGCCRGEVYNKTKDTCCEGQIKKKSHDSCCGDEPLFPGWGVQCCGGKTYNGNSQTCCNGIPVDGIGECCGGLVVNPGSDKCCRHKGEAHIHNNSLGSRCCGLDAYRPDEQLCCDSVVNVKTDNFTECCGNTTFNITTEVCCQGNVLPREPGKKSCCGGRLYDEDDEVCCRGIVHPGGGRAKCCNEEPFQEEKEVCFNDLVLNEHVPQIEGVVRLVENSTTAYLIANQFECGGSLVTRSRKQNACCNNTAYNSADQLCCEVPGSLLQIVTKGPTDDRCCGLESYNSSSQGCCNSTYHLQVYGLENEICNEGGVHPRYGDIETAKPCLQNKLDKDKVCKIGGNTEIPYNSNTSVCTPKGVMALSEDLDICGNKTFRRDLFICCRGKIITRHVKNETQECCPNPIDQETFIPTLQTCYNGRIVNIPEKHAGSCKGKVFDNRTYECDITGKVRFIARIQEEPHVCWLNETYYSYYNNNTHTCCNGHVIEATWTCCSEDSECCKAGDTKGYNRETHVCCGGVLREVPMKKPTNDCSGDNCPESGDNSLVCCQGISYENFDGELTCDGNLLTGRLRNNSIVCRGKLYNYGTDCCGDTSYDEESEICCGGVVESRDASTTCCGNHLYDPMNSDSLCCESSFYENATGLSCCGGVTYDNTTETCCTTGGKTYVFPSKDGLCCSNGKYYDDTLHTCCDGLVHQYVTNGACCGNDVIRDPTREGCYNDRIYQLGL